MKDQMSGEPARPIDFLVNTNDCIHVGFYYSPRGWEVIVRQNMKVLFRIQGIQDLKFESFDKDGIIDNVILKKGPLITG